MAVVLDCGECLLRRGGPFGVVFLGLLLTSDFSCANGTIKALLEWQSTFAGTCFSGFLERRVTSTFWETETVS